MKRYLLAALTLALLLAAVFTLAACGGGDTKDTTASEDQIRTVYAAYVAHAAEAGTTPLDYDTWLATIKGEKGDTGAQGPQGEKGDTGAQGPAGITPHIGQNGNWWVGETDTGVLAGNTAGNPATGEATDGLAYYPLPDGTYAVGAGYAKYLTEITIPATYNGKAVTAIDHDGFRGAVNLTSLTIPASVTSIGEYAFRDCTSLTSVTIPASVTSIGNYAFYACSALETITLPFVGATKDGTSNAHFGYIFGASSYTYNGDYVPTSLKTVVITGGTSIAASAFSGCSSLTSVTIPASVTSIGNSAFSDYTSLTIYCEATTQPRGWSSSWNYSDRPVVWGHSNITTDSTYDYVVHNGVAFLTKHKGSAKDVVIPTTIGGYPIVGFGSIFSKTDIISVTFAEGSQCTSIGRSAFSGCSSLTSVTIPASVTSIGNWAFMNCYSLTIYCEAAAKPSGWSSDWNYSYCPVVWNYKNK